MHPRLTNFLYINRLFFSHQFGFRNGYSTNHGLTSLTEMIRKALDEDKFACGVFIDLQKAFDTVDHGILLSKLNHYGVRGASYQWFKSYLTGRKQYTTISHLKSDLRSINYGVPQGSVLGPILLLLYINDLNQAIVHSKVHHFANVTNFLYASHSFSQSCQIWGQSHSKPFDMIQIAQNKALRIINFKQSIEPSEPLYQKLKINKLKNNIILNNCLFRFDKLINNLPDVFDQFFQPFKEQHDHSTRGSQQYLLNIQKQIHRCLVPIQ